MQKSIRWGILGPGAIAHKFARGLAVIPDAELVAVGSRHVQRAQQFATQYGASHAYGSYAELVADKQVDVVYVATPHSFHMEHTLLCLQAGKPVLCEKPFAINRSQVQEMVSCARQHGLFLMEAMWTRFLPVMRQVRQWLAEQAIGEVRMLTCDFGFRTNWTPTSRLFDPALGGGALLDVGVYTVSLASMVFQRPPQDIMGYASLGATGVDEQAAFILRYDQGELAQLSCAIRTNTPQEARIVGTEGSIHIPGFWHGTSAQLTVEGKLVDRFEQPFAGSGYEHEAMEVMRCLREGKLESDLLSLRESLQVMATADTLREHFGLSYPMEVQ